MCPVLRNQISKQLRQFTGKESFRQLKTDVYKDSEEKSFFERVADFFVGPSKQPALTQQTKF